MLRNFSARLPSIADLITFFFLSANLILRTNEIFKGRLYISLFVTLTLCICLFIVFFPQYLHGLLLVFGTSFPLYGLHSYSLNNQFFEFFLVIIALTFFFLNFKSTTTNGLNRKLIFLLLLYVGLSTFSLLLLPIHNVWQTIALWDIDGFSSFLLTAKPDSFFYSFAGINRLILFLLFVIQLARLENSTDLFIKFFVGILFGCVFAIIVGLFEYFDFVSLSRLRAEYDGHGNRLQSFFGNPGWYAEYTTITLPFLLLGFYLKSKGFAWKLFLLVLVVLGGITLIFTKSRGGWFTFLFILLGFLVAFYFAQKHKRGFKLDKSIKLKIAVFTLMLVSISIFLLAQLHGNSNLDRKNRNEIFNSNEDVAYIKSRLKKLLKPWEEKRLKIWYQAFQVGKEKPFFGMGYESYRWHISVQKSISESDFAQSRVYLKKIFDTPHSLYVQLFVSGGLTALLLWNVITLYALILLTYDLLINKKHSNIAVIFSIICFHIYGMFQSMQYIPMIWFIIFLNFGYAMTINEKVLPSSIRKTSRIICVAFPAIIFVGCLSYFQDIESNRLANKYGLEFYAENQNRDKFIGFYNLEKWEEGNYRWSGGKGIIRLDGAGLREVNFKCLHPDVEIEPVTLSVFLNDEPLDKIVFSKKGTVKRQYHIPETQREVNEMLIKVSRTWNPRRYGSSDNRNIGIAVSEMKLADKIAP